MPANKIVLSDGEVLIDLTKDTVTEDTLAEGATAHNAVGERIVGNMKSGIPVPETAEVGQTIRVSAVDENGKPTAWEAVDFPSGGASEWEIINEVTTTEEVTSIVIDTDKDGNTFNLDEIRVVLVAKGFTTTPTWYIYPCSVTASNINFSFPANTTLEYHYKKGSGYSSVTLYQYGYEFQTERITNEALDSNGNFTPYTIDRFRLTNFQSAVLPVGTHILVLGRRTKA